jgi:hypothetical protein
LLAIHHILFIKNIAIIKNNTKAIIVGSISDQNLSLELSFTITFVAILELLSHKSFRESVAGNIIISLLIFRIQLLSFSVTHESVAIALFQSISISL